MMNGLVDINGPVIITVYNGLMMINDDYTD